LQVLCKVLALHAYIPFLTSFVDELFGPRLGLETSMHNLVDKLDSMLPGIRIKERLMERIKNGAGHQGIIDYFAENGKRCSRS
jgi:hypothetical protein